MWLRLVMALEVEVDDDLALREAAFRADRANYVDADIDPQHADTVSADPAAALRVLARPDLAVEDIPGVQPFTAFYAVQQQNPDGTYPEFTFDTTT